MRFVEFKKYKTGPAGQAKGKDKMPKAKSGRKDHPLHGKLVGEGLLEADARIQHAEDIVFWEGSKGAMRVLKSLRDMAGGEHKNVTLKWDGSPALIFGRDENGEFILTDKTGFNAKTTNGRAKSPEELEAILLNRSGGKNKDDPGRQAFAQNMKSIFPKFEKALDKNFRGYFKGDLLYYTTPPVEDGHYTFQPQIVKYNIDTKSDLGKRIGQSDTGIVIHREVDAEGNESAFRSMDAFKGTEVFVVPSVTTEKPVEVDTATLDRAESIVKQNAQGLDAMLDEPSLRAKQLTDLPKIFYAYINSKVDTGLDNFGKDFSTWLSQSKLSEPKKANVLQYIKEHMNHFKSMWNVVGAIQMAKDDIIAKFDSQGGDVKQSINGKPGGEGYVLAHPKGDIKLVPRASFSAANRAVQR